MVLRALACASLTAGASTLDQRAGAAAAPEVVAFLDGYANGPSYWLDWPMETVTTIVMQGFVDPFLLDNAHAHGVRVLQTDGAAWDWLGNATERGLQIQQRVASVRKANLDGFGFDFEHINSTQMPQVVQYILELRQAYPDGFLTFYTNGYPSSWGWRPWSGPSMKTMAPALDLVIASAYTESNDTAPGFPKEAASCTEPCAVTSLPTVEAAVGHGNGGWDEYVPRSKLVLAVGWFMREWGMNASLPLAQRGDPLGGRISYCQAIGLRRSLHKDAAGQPRLDKASGTWSFTCRHDPHNASTFNSCGPHQSPNDQEYEVWYDDAESSRPKFEAVKSAGWRGVGMWQADGMWPYADDVHNISLWPECKPELEATWAVITELFGSAAASDKDALFL